MGANNIISGNASFAVGIDNTSSGLRSSSIGDGNNATGDYSLAFGYGNTSSGDSSNTMGYANTASGFYSVAIGLRGARAHWSAFICRTISATSGLITAKFGRIVSRIIRKDYCAHPAG